MILSIGMIVKNEEKYLRDCLNGLKPILDELNAELIINDTGSTDSTIQIAKEFTPNVIKTIWEDDFAKARQKTLDLAKGEWYMYIDADEIFDDVNDLINFFKTGEYKKYIAASIVLKNLKKGEIEDTTVIFEPLRLYKITKDLHWEHKIHEALTSQDIYLKGATHRKTLTSSAIHYGYYFETEEDKQKKLLRNKKLLLELYEQDPNHPKTILQLAKEYSMGNDNETSHDYLEKGIALYDKNTSEFYYHALVHELANCKCRMGKYEEAVKFINDYFRESSAIFANGVYLKHFAAIALQNLGRYKDAINELTKAIEYYNQRQKGQLVEAIFSFISVYPLSLDELHVNLIANNILAGDFAKALEWQDKLDDNNPQKKSDVFGAFAGNVALKKPQDLCKIYDFAIENYPLGTVEYDNAISVLERNLINPVSKALVSKVLENYTDIGDGYIHLQRLRRFYFSGKRGNRDRALESLSLVLNPINAFHQDYGDVIIAAMLLNIDFTPFLENLRITDTATFTARVVLSNDENICDILLDYLHKNPKVCNRPKTQRIISNILYLIHSQNPDNMPIFEAYIRMKDKYLRSVHTNDVYCEAGVLCLPEQDGFVYFSAQAYALKDMGDIAGFARNMRFAVQVYPDAKDIIGLIFEELKKQYQ